MGRGYPNRTLDFGKESAVLGKKSFTFLVQSNLYATCPTIHQSHSPALTSTSTSVPMLCVASSIGSRVVVTPGTRRVPVVARAFVPGAVVSAARVHQRVSIGKSTLRRASVVRATEEDTEESPAPVKTPATPTGKPGKPGVGKPPINPIFLAAGDFSAALLIVLIARGVDGQDIVSAGTAFAAAPFVVGWVSAGFLAGDYDVDSPNAALWGDAPRAMSTGALTWFSGSAFAILLRNLEGSAMIVAPALNEQVAFAGGLGLICAFRAAVAITKPGVEK